MHLGIDIGTSAVKLAVMRDGRVIEQSSADLSVASPRPGWSEQDPQAWWTAIGAAARKLSTDLGGVTGVGLSGQMHGAVLLDAQHRPLRPAILWNDSRAVAECKTLSERVPAIGQIAGVPPLPGFTAPKLLWLASEEPGLYARIAHLLLPKDYVALRLTGQCATDMSDAAGALLLDEAARDWSGDIVAAAGIDPAWLPRLLEGTEVAGRVTPEAAAHTGLPAGCPVVIGGGDTAVGAVAVGAVEPGRAVLSLGTSGQIFLAGDSYAPNPDAMLHAFAHAVPRRWYQMAAMLNGGRPLAWIAGQLSLGVPDTLALAATADPGRVPLFLPYLTGERSPHADPHIRAAFYGLEDSTDRAAIARAVIEAIAFSFADGAASFAGALDDVPQLLTLGGGARGDLVVQTISDATGLTLARAEGAAAGPALGAAKLAAVGTGAMTFADLSRSPEAGDIFTPQDSPDLAARLARYRALYRALRPLAATGDI